MPPIINKNKCIKCGTCAQICPLNVLFRGDDGNIDVKYPEECWHCRACVLDCPVKAISMRYPISHMVLHYETGGKQDEKNSDK